MKKIIAFLLVCMMVLPMTACGGSKSALAGQWWADGGSAPMDFPDSIEFFSDGTCYFDGMDGEYAVENGRLKLSAWGSSFVYGFKVGGDAMTLSYNGQTVSYGKGSQSAAAAYNADEGRNEDAQAAEAAPLTPSPEEQMAMMVAEEMAKIKAGLSQYDAADDVEGALQYVTEQLSLMDTTYPGADLAELEQLKASYMDTYRQRTLLNAKDAFDAAGYEAALEILHHSTMLLGAENEDINGAIESYKAYGPIAFEDFYNTDFYHETRNGKWSVDAPFKDNTGTEYSSAVNLYADALYDGKNLSKYVYLLSGNHSSFSGRLCLNYQSRSTPSKMVVRIYGDDTILWESPVMTQGVLPVEFNVNLSGYAQLTIESQVTAFVNYKHVSVYMVNGTLNP